MDAVCPEDGHEDLDVADLIGRGGTLYLLSTRDGGAAPLVTMLADHVVTTAMRVSQSRPGRRLDPPVRLVLDEAGTIARCPSCPS